jgi:hypothetical protein
MTAAGHDPRDLVYRASMRVPAPPEVTFVELERMGGTEGWPYADLLWQLRGLVDRLVGGVGMRGHPGPGAGLAEGQALDFWRVERVVRPSRLQLRAEMRLPGVALLEFEIEPDGPGSHLVQTARFWPRGLAGRLYWYGLLPIHAAIFRGMVRRLAARAARRAEKQAI